MLKGLWSLITGNPYVAAAIGAAVLGIVGGGVYYVHHQNATIASLHALHDADQQANGALSTQKASLVGEVADQQTQIAKLQQDNVDGQAAVALAHETIAQLNTNLDKVTAHASAAPQTDDGAVAPLMLSALSELCQSRPSTTAAGCGLQDHGGSAGSPTAPAH